MTEKQEMIMCLTLSTFGAVALALAVFLGGA